MTARSPNAAGWLYLANTVLLTVHEIDAAYWHEWELLRLPGGLEAFLVLHIPLLGVVLYGFWRVALWTRRARAFSYGLAFVGMGAVALHSVLLAAGTSQFRHPLSLLVLAGVLVASSIQIAVVRRSPPDLGGT